MAIRGDCFKTDLPALDPTELRWYHPEGSITLFPTIIPSYIHLAPPAQLLKLLKCGCSSEKPCVTMYTKRCSCQANEVMQQHLDHLTELTVGIMNDCACQCKPLIMIFFSILYVPTLILALVQIIDYQTLHGLGFYRCMIYLTYILNFNIQN